MTLTKTLAVAATAAIMAAGAMAGEMKIVVNDAYARSSNPKVAAAFMTLMNNSGEDDRLLSASSDIAKRVELHTHEEVDGVMKMLHVEEGFALPAGEMAALERGGQHVMFMGLSEPLEQGDIISVTLTFEQAGDIVIEIPIDNARKATHGQKDNGS